MKGINLNRNLILEAPERVADGAGGFTESWAELGRLWADVSARTGREVAGGTARMSNTAYRITVRSAPHGAPSRPQPGQRFRDGARVFRIEAVTEHDAGARFLTCFAEEEVAV
ncbi:head-tail adaptor protein [Roseovarius sp. LXJ103]|uniref:head-tail adaptor protein n=1 Tax=Roseovarius carneus TaxID=2853164 RepID=UPI000D60ADBE|nr:head-tail adaptor protein [Roseovarius carneus]MBZ8118512.1 head-tail adaptor protein [Roseovarius carneus]PWE35793.1 phage tail protein [Pelagicola sp. LXJ1103]